ncbi:uncharacterized protein EI90DRAFT_3035096 [Cantharellus anzutake]|uniref:uncharacterized protein n=1 Tax=Cantharellus anzutake TaxID=1750568 RepID=UPI001906FE43|nr:uncharacterized protein EI90DRAFT_3131796 [Cantharellus anzutake]XP_038921655.1 uncharacterized protein EI90DRAFT_3035096 [Cantharellus anzutake]KAF8320966.1 hypothetical protein EI90DRAFT_3131796 [Cantharellus anzutake]KAF8340293.1 hypothetical protein EI90DRAFT_3035096 [Cantharellus anzutake]
MQGNACSRIFVRYASSTRGPFRTPKPNFARVLNNPSAPHPSPSSAPSPAFPPAEPNTHYRVTLHRSAIGLPKQISRTLEALGLHKRMQTVFHEHSPDIAGKLLQVKELVQVANVPADAVRSARELREERRAVRGYDVVQRRPYGNGHLTLVQAVQEQRLASHRKEKARRLGETQTSTDPSITAT